MIIIVSFEIHHEWFHSMKLEGGTGKKSAFKAMTFIGDHDPTGTESRIFAIVCELIEMILNLSGSVKLTEKPAL